MDDPNGKLDLLFAEQIGTDLHEFPRAIHNNLIVHLGIDLDEPKNEELSSNPIRRKERRISN